MPQKKSTGDEQTDEQTDETTAQAADAGETADDTVAGEAGTSAGVTLSRTELERLRQKLWDRYHSGLSR